MSGAVRFIAKFNDGLMQAIKITVSKEFDQMHDEIVEEAIRDAPVGETYTLASPQTIKKVKTGSGETNVVAETEGKPYPSWVEHGTFDHQAQPFLWPAYRRAKDRFIQRITGRIK